MVQRPLWPDSRPEDIEDWRPLTDDFLHFLDAHQTAPIACVGHSMGGIALLRAALREPERFKAIVLLDPVLFPPYFIKALASISEARTIASNSTRWLPEPVSAAANLTISSVCLKVIVAGRYSSIWMTMP